MNTKLNYDPNWTELAKQAKWSVSRMAKLCNVSPRTLERYFIKEFGKAPKTWLKEQRQKLAEKFLQNGSSVKETAAVLGYSQIPHFSNEFKKNRGYCPTKFGRLAKCRILA